MAFGRLEDKGLGQGIIEILADLSVRMLLSML